jgi:hypothetical protein
MVPMAPSPKIISPLANLPRNPIFLSLPLGPSTSDYTMLRVPLQEEPVGEPRHRDHFFRVLKGVLGLYQKESRISLKVESLSDFLRLIEEGGS